MSQRRSERDHIDESINSILRYENIPSSPRGIMDLELGFLRRKNLRRNIHFAESTFEVATLLRVCDRWKKVSVQKVMKLKMEFIHDQYSSICRYYRPTFGKETHLQYQCAQFEMLNNVFGPRKSLIDILLQTRNKVGLFAAIGVYIVSKWWLPHCFIIPIHHYNFIQTEIRV